MRKIYCKVPLNLKDPVAYLRSYLEEGSPKTYYVDGDGNELDCDKGKNRSVSAIHQLLWSQFDTSFEESVKTINKVSLLLKSPLVFKCPDIGKAVVLNSASWEDGMDESHVGTCIFTGHIDYETPNDPFSIKDLYNIIKEN